MVMEMIEQLIEWKNNGFNVKWIRCDNAGENLLLKSTCASVDYMLPITFEITARDTPQQNWLVERGFPVIPAKARAMMSDANVPMSLKYLVFREALMTATLLDGLVVLEIDGKAATRYVHFYGESEAADDEVSVSKQNAPESDDEEESEEELDEDDRSVNKPAKVSTRFGRLVIPPKRLIEEIGLAELDEMLNEFTLVGAGLGGGFENTMELKVLNYKQAIESADSAKWKEAVEEEYKRMISNNVWQAINKNQVPAGAKILTCTWAMKKKANGVYRSRLVARGFEQNEGEHYMQEFISAPVVNDVTIRIVWVLIILLQFSTWLMDVHGAFLLGRFSNGEKLYMKVPQGMEGHYNPSMYYLLLLRTIYGLKQSAAAFWKELRDCFDDMGFMRSDADPCLYFRWDKEHGLVVVISWIDDLLIVGKKEMVEATRKQFNERFECDDVGEMTEYIGCNIEYDQEQKQIKVTQPVLIQSFVDEFKIDPKYKPSTPAEPGSVLF
jgi:hypothetical protein